MTEPLVKLVCSGKGIHKPLTLARFRWDAARQSWVAGDDNQRIHRERARATEAMVQAEPERYPNVDLTLGPLYLPEREFTPGEIELYQIFNNRLSPRPGDFMRERWKRTCRRCGRVFERDMGRLSAALTEATRRWDTRSLDMSLLD